MVNVRTLFFYAILALGVYTLTPFLFVILLSFITAYALYPFLSWLRNYVKYKSIALFLLICWVFIPLYFFSILTYIEFQKLIPVLPFVQQWVSDAFVQINIYTPDIIAKYNLGTFIQTGTIDMIEFLRQFMIAKLTVLAVSLPWVLLQFILYIFSTYYILKDFDIFSKKTDRYIEILSGEKKEFVQTIVNGIKNSFNFLIFNYVVLAIVIGLMTYIIFLIAGMPFSLLFALIIALITFVPNVGPWPFIGLIGIGYYFTGINTQGAIGIIAYSLICLVVFEYFIRPSYGAKVGGVHPLTTLFGLLGGTIVFGIKGVLLGPMILILAETFVRTHYKMKEKEAEKEKETLTRTHYKMKEKEAEKEKIRRRPVIIG
ncbi:MAG: AI-2E family transporter [Candidatus Aenigmarchaeota archaeon]|nr:AI-2E family transporter [Candidatus Aenigmarchaeota archaeon]